MKLKICFLVIAFAAANLVSCDKTQPVNDYFDVQPSDLMVENSAIESCLPNNIQTLSIRQGEDKIDIWKVGYWHNLLLEGYLLSPMPQAICNCDRVSYTSNLLSSLAASNGSEPLYYLDTVGAFNCTYLEPFLFSCDIDAVAISRQIIIELQLQVDTMNIFSPGERSLIIETLDYALNGFEDNSEKYDLIEKWKTLDDKFLDGVVSGGIISILLYSDCFWGIMPVQVQQNTSIIEFRALPGLALIDVAGGGLSFINRAVRGSFSGENADPQAGLRYLRQAGMDALRVSAGPFGVLF